MPGHAPPFPVIFGEYWLLAWCGEIMLVVGSGEGAPVFVGREEELAALDAALERVRAGPAPDQGNRARDPMTGQPAARSVPAWAGQGEYGLRFQWGPWLAPTLTDGVCVVVDVLRFTTAVEAAVSHGVAVYPYRWRDVTAAAFAESVRALLADGRDPAGPSLSPSSMRALGQIIRMKDPGCPPGPTDSRQRQFTLRAPCV